MDAKHELREIDRVMRELASEAKDALNQVCLLQQALSARDRRIRDLEQALGEAVAAGDALVKSVGEFREVQVGFGCDSPQAKLAWLTVGACVNVLDAALAHCREVLEKK